MFLLRDIFTGINENIFPSLLNENSTDWQNPDAMVCSQEVRATLRYEQIDGGFIFDYKLPIPCRSEFMDTMQEPRICF